MKSNLFKVIAPCFVSVLLMIGCSNPGPYVHSITKVEGISNSTITYQSADSVIATGDLAKGDLTVVASTELANIGIQSASGKLTIFSEIPEKYINMDVNIEVAQNVFMDYFPEEWSDLKKANYTSLHMVSKKDASIFFTSVVYTNTATEIGRHSEDTRN
jgi:hypothetical protein